MSFFSDCATSSVRCSKVKYHRAKERERHHSFNVRNHGTLIQGRRGSEPCRSDDRPHFVVVRLAWNRRSLSRVVLPRLVRTYSAHTSIGNQSKIACVCLPRSMRCTDAIVFARIGSGTTAVVEILREIELPTQQQYGELVPCTRAIITPSFDFSGTCAKKSV